MHDQPARRPRMGRLLYVALAGACALEVTACAPAQVITRTADTWPCVAESHTATASKGAPILGWMSFASIDRWIATIDDVGQRAGMFAAGSSVRTRAQEDAIAGLAKIGVQGVRWLDPTRPWHLTWQPTQGSKAATKADQSELLSMIVPTRGMGTVEDALGKSIQGTHPDAPGVVVRLGKRKGWLSYLNHYTALLSFNAAQHSRVATAARCLHNRRPKALLHMGVAVAELARRHPDWFEEGAKAASKEIKNSPAMGGLLDDWVEQLRELVAQTVAVEAELLTDKRRATVAANWRAVSRSALAKRFERLSRAPPNPLTRLLPASSYIATGTVMDAQRDLASSRKSLDAMLDVLKVPAGMRERLAADLDTIVTLSGLHSAAAFYRAGHLAVATDIIWSSSDAPRQVQLTSKLLLDVTFAVFQASRQEALAKARSSPKAAADVDALLATAQTSGWSGLFLKLVQHSAKWPVRLTLDSTHRKGLACDVLKAEIDWARIRRGLPMAGAARGLLGDKLGLGLCTTPKLGMLLIHADVIGEAGRIAEGKGQGLAGTEMFQKGVLDTGRQPQWFTLIDPAPMVQMARQVLGDVPAWPKGQPVVAACRYGKERIRCRLDAPLALAELVAPYVGG